MPRQKHWNFLMLLFKIKKYNFEKIQHEKNDLYLSFESHQQWDQQGQYLWGTPHSSHVLTHQLRAATYRPMSTQTCHIQLASCLKFAKRIEYWCIEYLQGHAYDSWLVCCPFRCVTIDIMNDVMNDNMAAFAHFGTRLGAFFYWTRFLENNVPFNNIPL